MKLRPRLVPSIMQLSFGKKEVSGKEKWQVEHGRRVVNVELWESVGLCVHAYNDTFEMDKKWRVSHMESGRAVLQHMKDREQAIKYMMIVKEWKSVEGIQVNWKMTVKQFDQLHYREEIIGMIRGLQKKISGERR